MKLHEWLQRNFWINFGTHLFAGAFLFFIVFIFQSQEFHKLMEDFNRDGLSIFFNSALGVIVFVQLFALGVMGALMAILFQITGRVIVDMCLDSEIKARKR